MTSFLDVSYTGDILAHRRCPRSWSYERHAKFHPYEQVQALEGRLTHHAMEWLEAQYRESGSHSTESNLHAQLTKHARVLRSRGIRTRFAKTNTVVERVVRTIFPQGRMDPTVSAVLEGAIHSEYELRTVRRLLAPSQNGERCLLTGVLDVVVQQTDRIVYYRQWRWDSLDRLTGQADNAITITSPGDVEVWDYKATPSDTPYAADYVRQLVTYAALYEERSGKHPVRCVVYFMREPDPKHRLLVVDVTPQVIEACVAWTDDQVAALTATARQFEKDPSLVVGGNAGEVSAQLKQQCTACGQRFDCEAYRNSLSLGPDGHHPDLSLFNVEKN